MKVWLEHFTNLPFEKKYDTNIIKSNLRSDQKYLTTPKLISSSLELLKLSQSHVAFFTSSKTSFIMRVLNLKIIHP